MKTLTASFILLLTINQVAYSQEQQSNTFGSLLGSILGGVVGYQFGGGTGKYISTAAGALIGSQIGKNVQQKYNGSNQYQPDYAYKYPTQSVQPQYQNSYNSSQPFVQRQYYSQTIVVAEDDYIIKQRLSDQAKRRNMIRNGELDPYELPYDQSSVQTSWDDPNN